MAVYLFTFHTYRSWLPDRPQGYVTREDGLLPSSEAMGEQYRKNMKQGGVMWEAAHQRAALEAVLEKCGVKGWTLLAGATEPTHVHVVVSWRDEVAWLAVRAGLKGEITRRLNAGFAKRRWLSEGGSRKQVCDAEHLWTLRASYLPSHRGWAFDERSGWREPRG